MLLRYRNAEQFLSKVQHFLEAEEALNNLILSACLNIKNNDDTRIGAAPYFAAVEDKFGLSMVAQMNPPFPFGTAFVLMGRRKRCTPDHGL